MKNQIYTEFLKDIVKRDYRNLSPENFSNITEIKDYGTNKDSFKFAYEVAAQGWLTTIFHLDNLKTIRVGFIECVENGFKKDGGWYQRWHTVRIQAWRTGSKSDPSYHFDFEKSLQEDILRLERMTKKRLDTYQPLFVSCLNQEDYVYLGDGVKLFKPEYQKARKEWFEANDDKTFYEFLEEIREEQCSMKKN